LSIVETVSKLDLLREFDFDAQMEFASSSQSFRSSSGNLAMLAAIRRASSR
jgi:hypothetical protein